MTEQTIHHLLLVEDNPTDVLLAKYALEEQRWFALTVAERLGQALELLRDCRFDVVLLDLGLPDSQGLETLRKVRQGHADIPVVVMSGRDDEELALKAVHEGAQDYLIKNQVGNEMLRRSIRYAIARQRDQMALRQAHDDLEGRKRRLAMQYATVKILAEVATLEEAAPQVLQAICEHVNWDVGTLWVMDRNTKVLRCAEVWHAPRVEIPAFEQVCRQSTFAHGIGLPGRVWASQAHSWIPDVTTDVNFPRAQVAAEEGLHGAVGFPIKNDLDFFGVIECFSRQIQPLDDDLIDTMDSLGCQISQFIQRKKTERALQRQEADRAIAQEIQQGLLPQAIPPLPGFQIGGRSLAAKDVGGECFDVIPFMVRGQEFLGVLLANARGQGIAAALLMAQTRAYLRALATTYSGLDTILALTNRLLTGGFRSDHLVSVFLGQIQPDTRSLVYANAGYCHGYALDRQGKTKGDFPTTGPYLGVDPASKFPISTISFAPGDLILLMTDGFIKATSQDGELFGRKRILNIVRTHLHETPAAILDALFGSVSDFTGHNLQDDITAVVIKAEND